jgi:prepilin-type N-terminal cleavage/methylation domain-containing protein
MRPRRQFPAAAAAGRRAAFTLLELMLAVTIFGLVLTAIYSTWTAILRTARVGNDVAANAQRTRLAARTIEDALVSAVMFQANAPLYTFLADTSGDFATLSLVSRLPPSFPGSGYFGDLAVRRVEFTVETAPDGTNDLILRQLPLLQSEQADTSGQAIVLARDVQQFTLEFLGRPGQVTGVRGEEWLTEWPLTNALPWVVRFRLAFGGGRDRWGQPANLAVRTVLLPAQMVPGASSQGSAPVMPVPGAPPTNAPVPGTPPPVLNPGGRPSN